MGAAGVSMNSKSSEASDLELDMFVFFYNQLVSQLIYYMDIKVMEI